MCFVSAPVPSTTPDHTVQAENLEGGSASGSTNSIVESSIIITENVENSVCMQDKETERNAAASSADAGPVNFSSSVVETCETSKNTAEKENDGNGEVNENFVKIDEEQQQQQQEEICSADLVEETLAVDSEEDKPPIPLPTYRWEDIKKAKEQVSRRRLSGHQYILNTHLSCVKNRNRCASFMSQIHISRICNVYIIFFLGRLSLDPFVQKETGRHR